MAASKHVFDDIPAYTLGILSDSEQRLVAEHLAECTLCQSELQGYQSVVDQLPLAVSEISPSPRLKTLLMSQVTEKPAARQKETPPNWIDGLRGFFQRVTPVWAGVSLVLVIALAATNFLLWRQVRQAEERSALAFTTLEMKSDVAAPEAEGLIVITPDGRYGTLVVNGLPALPDDRQYQLWLVQGEQRISGGVFSVANSGYGALLVKAPQPLSEYSRFGVTIEPYGGSPGPTGDRVLAGSF